jgi:S-adenosylmethionine decarboxylase
MSDTTVHQFSGVHVLGEIYGVKPELLDNLELLENAIKAGIEQSGATLCGLQSKQFEPYGVTILALLSESHASIHTYPDQEALFFDAFTCGDTCDPRRICEALVEALDPADTHIKVVRRGHDELSAPHEHSAISLQDSYVSC